MTSPSLKQQYAQDGTNLLSTWRCDLERAPTLRGWDGEEPAQLQGIPVPLVMRAESTEGEMRQLCCEQVLKPEHLVQGTVWHHHLTS